MLLCNDRRFRKLFLVKNLLRCGRYLRSVADEDVSLAEKQVFFFFLFRARPVTYESSQARGLIRDTAAGLHYSHSNTESKPCLRTTPQLMARSDP